MREIVSVRMRLCLVILSYGLLYLGLKVVIATNEYSRHDFPPGFIFGASTSAYQVEGAAFEDGRKLSIFDTFVHSGRMDDNGDIACDGYHKYKEDVQLMVETGLNAYRFSISWSRLIPDGRGLINPKGLIYYNNLINELISNGIEPHVTLLHSDVPEALEDEYNGCLSRRFIEDFTAYTDVCFKEFGDRVKHWTTFNEANIFTAGGYDVGNTPPGRCSSPFGFGCPTGDSTVEPYIVAHHILLAHASAASLYKLKYKATQHGFIGLNLFTCHFIPFTNTSEDILATRRAYDFLIGWFMHPLTYGDYPDIMIHNVGTRLPTFTQKESKLLKGSFDFIGINYYYVTRAKSERLADEPSDYLADTATKWIGFNSSIETGESFRNTPWGLQGVLAYFKQVYDNPPIFVHENGQVTAANTTINDQVRVEFLQDHIVALLDTVRNGSNTKGYFVWSFLDVFELLFGYKGSFGLYYVDFNDPTLPRYPKLSQQWYSQFLKGISILSHTKGNKADYEHNTL